VSFQLLIGGVDKTDRWLLPGDRGEFDATLMAGERGTFHVTLYDLDGATGYRAAIDQTITLKQGGVVKLAGIIDDYVEDAFTELDTGLKTALTASDWHAYLDRVEFIGTIPAGTSLRTAAQQILTDSGLAAAPFLITLDAGAMGTGLPDGPLLTTDTTFDGSGKAGFDKLRALTSYIYRVDAALVLFFQEPGFVSCGYSLSDADTAIDGVVGTVSYHQSRATNYYNRVRVVAGPSGTGDAIVTTWPGNGVDTVFAIRGRDVPASSVWPGVINVDGVDWPLHGPGGAPGGNGIEWDYTVDDGTLSFLGTSAALALGATLIALTYVPQFPFTVLVADAGQIAAHGPYTSPRVLVPEVLTYVEAVAIGNAVIRQRITTPKVATVRTGKGMAYPGQSIALSFVQRNLTGTFLITAVDLQSIEEDQIEFTLTCVDSAELPETWLDFYGGTGSSATAGGIVASTGGSSTTIITGPILLGGARNVFAAPSPADWTPVPNWVPFVCATSTSLRLRAYAAAREAGISVEVRLYDMTTPAAVPGSTSAPITATVFTAFTATVAVLAGRTYRLEVRNSSAGHGVSAIGVLEGL
jgi:hypothetical protein